MRIITLLFLVLTLTACGQHTQRTVLNEWWMSNVNPNGLTSYDPPNGDWIFIRNEPGGSNSTLKRTQDWDWTSKKAPQY